MQTLYERHKVLSYPRTDSKHLTTDMAATMKDRLHAVQGFSPDVVKKALKNGGQVTQKGVFNNSKVTDHHGIIPTEERPRVEKMESDELKIYRMVVERFLGLFLPAYQAKKTTYQFLVEGIQFQCQQEEVIEAGWKQVEAPKVEASYKKGETLKNPQFAINKHLTEAPSRLTEATLLQKMEKTGLGTPATRAEIIEKLISSELMERAQNKLSVSPKGRQLLTLVNPTLVTPDLTAKWEKALEEIAASKLKKKSLLNKSKLKQHA